ncbi:MAG: DUF4332 domain-containing protein [Planctomycetes bacterium]|nr:DUF4332 domain-containing protein [Planctomycetota bacterium]
MAADGEAMESGGVPPAGAPLPARSEARRRAGWVLLFAGLALGALAAWGLWRDVEWIAQPFYPYAWWSVILVLDGFSSLRRGHSLLTARWRCLGPIAVGSVTFWFAFELLNVRIQNWYYVGVFPASTPLGVLGAGLFTVLSFATVFTGIFEMHEALTAAGLWVRRRRRPGRTLPARVSYALQLLGLAMAGAAVAFPRYLGPLIWGSVTLIVDPWNYRRGSRSALRDLEAGDRGGIARLLLAGLLCGLVWEGLNFFAPQKWIYTVRGLEGLKLFEMPLPGFLGFPALAFDCMAAYSLLASFFFGNETWEHPGDLAYVPAPRLRPPRWAFWATVPAQAAFWGAVSILIEANVGSLQVELEDLRLSQRERAALREQGIGRPGQLLRATRAPGSRAGVLERLAWDERRLAEALDEAELFLFKGIGAAHGRLLQRTGVRTVDDLGAWRPLDLTAALEAEASRRGARAPRLDMVRVWVLASRDRGIVLSAEGD